MILTKKMNTLTTTPSGQRILQLHHLDDNNSMLEMFFSVLIKGVYLSGGVILPGVITAGTTTLRVQSYAGVTMDGESVVRIIDETKSVTGVPVGEKALLLCDTTPVTVNRTYVDPVSATTITDAMLQSVGTLQILKASDPGVTLDSDGYPVLSGPGAPILKFYRDTASHITLEGSVPSPVLNQSYSFPYEWQADGNRYFLADRTYTLTALEGGTGTLTVEKSTDGGGSFSAATAPYVLAAGDILRLSVSGLAGFKTVTLKQ
ncbi:hypothetical protein [Deinococcus cellulosilyticus]|uniref:Uncharacterized protein n=1 Tax=Deinococcus cellulosilyticus (strain DSM 18568 / NBRC 106333 / KACC 11606 / 5516J-15) TaxID=1223518 RepID=A0A511N4B8_DEIC1|nr:hypothetical protein [Deinococcus cellulosilyticus]GEM47221.1 hypothetical protein DC3_28560 [Deinococcus cellulosilyticus NBRC 106333 = KACC 11606]